MPTENSLIKVPKIRIFPAEDIEEKTPLFFQGEISRKITYLLTHRTPIS